VEKLVSTIGRYIKEFPITLANLASVAATADEFHQFPDESNNLFEACIEFFIKFVKLIPNFLATNMNPENQGTILRLMAAANTKLCYNCKARKELCQSGKYVESLEYLTVGIKVLDVELDDLDTEERGPPLVVEDVDGEGSISLIDGDGKRRSFTRCDDTYFPLVFNC
jgi:hypothetical protein